MTFLFELKAHRKIRQLTKLHRWLRWQGASNKLHPVQRRDLMRAAEAIVSQLEGKNP